MKTFSLLRALPGRSLSKLLLTLTLAACSSSSSGSGVATATEPAQLAPVPAPPDLALECVLPAPDATWAKAREQIGGFAAFLPTTAGGLVAVSLHFPLALSEAIDGRVPAVCAAALAKDGSAAHGVMGVHLRWPDRLVDGLTKGPEARFQTHHDPVSGIDVLEARDAKDAALAAGVLGNYLLVAASAADLSALGPYVARTMPARASAFPTAGVRIAGAKEEAPIDFVARVPQAAMGGAVASAAARAFAALTARLTERLPLPLPFSDDANAALAVVPDLDGAELRVTIGDHTTRVEASAPVRKGTAGEKSVRAIAAGDAAPLLALPRDTLAAMLVRRIPPSPGAAASPAAHGSTAAEVAKALGLNEAKDAAKIEATAKAFDDARGDWTSAGVVWNGLGPSAFVRAAVRDPAALDIALKDFLALADGARPTEPVRGTKLVASTGKTVLENIVGDVFRVRLARGDAAKKSAEPPSAPTDTPSAVDVLFRRSDDVFVAATGYASREALRAVLLAPNADSLQKVPELSEPLGRLGSGVAIAGFFDPGRYSATRAGKPGTGGVAPVVVGLGRDLGDTVTVFARLDAPNSALAELVRWTSP